MGEDKQLAFEGLSPPDPLHTVYKDSPIVKAVMDLGRQAGWSRNEILEQCVLELHKALTHTQKELVRKTERSWPVLVPKTSGEEELEGQ